MTDTRPIRVALYARVSTSNHGQDVTVQTRELKEFVERRGWQIAGENVDLGISGSKVRRPELDRLIADAGRHPFAWLYGVKQSSHNVRTSSICV